MPDIGLPEILIALVVLVLLFGPGKAADLGGALGRSVRDFKRESNREDGDVVPAHRTSARYCGECGSSLANAASFCGECGRRVATTASA